MELFARPEASGRPDRTSGRCNTKIECIYRLFHGRVLISSSDYYSTCQEVSRAPMDPFAGPEASGPTNRASGRCKTEEKCKLFSRLFTRSFRISSKRHHLDAVGKVFVMHL